MKRVVFSRAGGTDNRFMDATIEVEVTVRYTSATDEWLQADLRKLPRSLERIRELTYAGHRPISLNVDYVIPMKLEATPVDGDDWGMYSKTVTALSPR